MGSKKQFCFHLACEELIKYMCVLDDDKHRNGVKMANTSLPDTYVTIVLFQLLGWTFSFLVLIFMYFTLFIWI